MASVSRDRCGIFLVQGDQGHPGACVRIGVADVELIFEEYQGKGAKTRHPPTNYSWAREMQIEGPDVTCFASARNAVNHSANGSTRSAIAGNHRRGRMDQVESD